MYEEWTARRTSGMDTFLCKFKIIIYAIVMFSFYRNVLMLSFFSYLNSIVMFSINFFGVKVRFIVPMVGQRGFFGFAA